jgi:hypothetical protein
MAWLSLPDDQGIRAITEVGMCVARVLHLSSHLFAAIAILPFVESPNSRCNLEIESSELNGHLVVRPEQKAVNPLLAISR